MARRLSVPAARAALGALALGWVLTLSPAGVAASTEAIPELATFGLTSASGGVLDDRSFLAMTAPPGSVIYDSVAVVNQSDTPLDLALYSADAQNAADGAIGLPDRTVAPTDAGAWITVGSSTVTVPPQSSEGIGYTVVPITITVPADAEPGDHVAGVVTSLTAQGTAASGDQSATVNLEQRVGLRVYITVDGPIHPGLTITGLKATYHQAGAFGLAGAGSATVTYTLTNSGNSRLAVQPSTVASGLFGLLEARATGVRIDELLPRSSVTQTVELTDVWPVVLDRVTVSAAVSAPVSGDEPRIGTPTESASMWAIPWAYLAIAAIAAIGWWLVRRVRRRRVSRGRHAQGPALAGTRARVHTEPTPLSPAAAEEPAPKQFARSRRS